MRRDDVPPFLVPSGGDIRATDWIRVLEETADSVDDYIPDWDQNTELHFRCMVVASVSKIEEVTGLPHSTLGWTIGWEVTETGLVGPSQTIAVSDDEVEVDLFVPPRYTGNTIRLTRRLVVVSAPSTPRSPLRAHMPGSILWSDSKQIRLSGTGASFPTEIVDFAKVPTLARLARNSWYLELPDSVEQPVLGGLLLLVNSSDHALAAAVSAHTPDDQQRVLVQTLQEDVTGHLIRWALMRWEELKDLDDSSVGSVARVLTERILPDPVSWSAIESDAMELHAKIIDGARRIGLGRALS